MKLFQLKTIFLPTWRGWIVLFFTFGLMATLFLALVDPFLAQNIRANADVLVVEGWISRLAMPDAMQEYKQHQYQWVATSGASSEGDWSDSRDWSYAELAAGRLKTLGMDPQNLISAPAKTSDKLRTREAALAVRDKLAAQGIKPKAINVFTRGIHARRSRLVYQKVFGTDTKVGVLAWERNSADKVCWCNSSDRAREIIPEFFGWFFEAVRFW